MIRIALLAVALAMIPALPAAGVEIRRQASVYDARGHVDCDDRFAWTCDTRGWRWAEGR